MVGVSPECSEATKEPAAQAGEQSEAASASPTEALLKQLALPLHTHSHLIRQNVLIENVLVKLYGSRTSFTIDLMGYQICTKFVLLEIAKMSNCRVRSLNLINSVSRTPFLCLNSLMAALNSSFHL